MGLSITIASGKGGVGKTILAANLGAAIAGFGKDVTVLDADIEMANLELHFGLEGMKTTLYDVLRNKADIKDAIYKGPGGVKVVPSGISLYKLRKAELAKLKDILEELLKGTEVLLIDAPPGIGGDVVAVLAAGQELLLVVTPEFASIPGALKTKEVAKKLGTHVLGVVVNRAGHDESDLKVEEIETILGLKVLGAVPEDPEVRRSVGAGQPIVLRSPDSPAALAIKKLAAELIGVKYTPPAPKSLLRFFKR
ncbi:MAG: P-loop NTPase [Euryarchaeota archaeon]|nr:P-loop NTPase [Euryarchaeota archaeon]